MFIELTDHLRCPDDHDEGYLVLLPDRWWSARCSRVSWGARSVIAPCTSGTASSTSAMGRRPMRADRPGRSASVAALAGLGGPGGYLVLVGPDAGRWRGSRGRAARRVIVAVNGPAS